MRIDALREEVNILCAATQATKNPKMTGAALKLRDGWHAIRCRVPMSDRKEDVDGWFLGPEWNQRNAARSLLLLGVWLEGYAAGCIDGREGRREALDN